MSGTKRRTGRPGREPAEGERVGLSLRVTPATKRALDAAAGAMGRSLSQEAELRIEHSFHDEGLLPQALDLAYGPQAAALILVLGRGIYDAANAYAMRMALTGDGPRDWQTDRAAFDEIERVILRVLEAFRPAGDPVHPSKIGKTSGGTDFDALFSDLGRKIADPLLAAIAGIPASSGLAHWATAVRERIEPTVIERIKSRPQPDVAIILSRGKHG